MSICFDLYYIKKRGHVQRPSSSHNIKGEAMSNVLMCSGHKLFLGPTPLSWPFNIVFWTYLNVCFEVENDLKCIETGSWGGFFLFTTMEINLQVDELSSSFSTSPLSQSSYIMYAISLALRRPMTNKEQIHNYPGHIPGTIFSPIQH